MRWLVPVAFVLACRTGVESAPRVLPLDEGPLYSSPERVQAACELALSEVRAVRARLLAVAPERADLKHVLLPYNQLMGTLENSLGLMGLLANVHPEAPIRKASETCEQSLQKLASEIQLDPGLYARLEAVDPTLLDEEARRFRAKVQERLTLSGVNQPPEVRARLAALHAAMVETGQTFQRNIRDDVRRIEVEPAQLAGLPEDFVKAHPINPDGKVVLDTNYPDYFPVQTYAKDGALRESLLRAFSTRGHPVNEPVLRKLLELRHEYARLLGHRSWAELSAKDKMAASADRIRSFTDEIAEQARPRMQEDLAEVLEEKQRHEPDARRVEKWDRLYYVKEVQKRKHDFDPAAARAYFAYPAVLKGAFALFSELFELEFVPLDRPVWHPSVRSYELHRRGALVGRFFLDMHPRDGKYRHAAMFPITVGRRGAELAEAALVCNFPDPSQGPALMEHSQVVTFFHELGHLLHHLLARGSVFVNQSGISTEWDFVEAPSQLLEEWAWDPAVLARFARHHESGEVIPTDLVERMRAARDFGLGVHVMRQVFYQSLSLELHDRSPEGLDLDALQDELERRHGPYPPVPGTYEYASFGHLDGYSSMYYTYQWSLALAKDMLTRFQREGLLSAATARAYRELVLEAGGMKPAAALVKDFLGRETNLEAYRAWLLGPPAEAAPPVSGASRP